MLAIIIVIIYVVLDEIEWRPNFPTIPAIFISSIGLGLSLPQIRVIAVILLEV